MEFTLWNYILLILVIARFIYDLAWNLLNNCAWHYPGDGKGSMLERIDSFVASITGWDRIDVHWGLKMVSLMIAITLCSL